MSEPARFRAFFQRWKDHHGVETSLIDGDKAVGPVHHAGMVIAVPNVRTAIRDAIGGAMRSVALVLFLSPLLIVPKLLSPRWLSDYITIGFVITVVTFFALLALFFIVSFVWWSGRDKTGLRFADPPPNHGGEAIAVAVASDAPPRTLVRARGRVVALDGATTVVVRAVAGHDGHPWRFVEATDFAVMPKDGLPIVANVRAAPLVIAPATSLSTAGIADKLDAETLVLGDVDDGGDYVEIATGDEVEIVGTVDRVIPDSNHFTIDGVARKLPQLDDGDPYRRPAGPAIVVGVEPDPRITVRRLTA